MDSKNKFVKTYCLCKSRLASIDCKSIFSIRLQEDSSSSDMDNNTILSSNHFSLLEEKLKYFLTSEKSNDTTFKVATGKKLLELTNILEPGFSKTRGKRNILKHG